MHHSRGRGRAMIICGDGREVVSADWDTRPGEIEGRAGTLADLRAVGVELHVRHRSVAVAGRDANRDVRRGGEYGVVSRAVDGDRRGDVVLDGDLHRSGSDRETGVVRSNRPEGVAAGSDMGPGEAVGAGRIVAQF